MFLETFERIAVCQRYPRDLWALHLSSLSCCRALDAYAQLSSSDDMDYDKLKRICKTESGEAVKQLPESVDRDGKRKE